MGRRITVVGLAVLTAWQPACDGPTGPEPLDVGTVELPLETTSDGVNYRLQAGSLLFFELGERTPFLAIDDLTPSILSVPLAPGRYIVELVDGATLGVTRPSRSAAPSSPTRPRAASPMSSSPWASVSTSCSRA